MVRLGDCGMYDLHQIIQVDQLAEYNYSECPLKFCLVNAAYSVISPCRMWRIQHQYLQHICNTHDLVLAWSADGCYPPRNYFRVFSCPNSTNVGSDIRKMCREVRVYVPT